MNATPGEIHLHLDALWFTGAYLLAVLVIGFVARSRRKENSLRDFYLGGSSFGFFVLFLTFFATQYSGNTVLGFAGQTYSQGATYVVSVSFMIAVTTMYVLYAPRLSRLARRHGYVTPADFVHHRFGSHALRLVATALMCWGLANYILEQLVAMGRAMEAISDGRVPFMLGVVVLALVMVVYESLGGMRAVAWTDALQGGLLLFGFGVVLFVVATSDGGLPAAGEFVAANAPEKFESPGARGLAKWFGTLVLLGVGISFYPHAIQRVFAAKSTTVLRRSIALMAFMPFATTLLAFLIGIVGLRRFPGLEGGARDGVTILMMSDLAAAGGFRYWLVVLLFAGVVAAIMSTADSALLAMQSMIAKDVYKPWAARDVGEGRILFAGKVSGWGILAFLILMAWVSERTQSSIWLLIRLKIEFMAQIAPLFVFGLFRPRLGARAALAGVVAGTTLTLVPWLGCAFLGWDAGWREPFGVQAGVWGLALNVAVCFAGEALAGRDRAAS